MPPAERVLSRLGAARRRLSHDADHPLTPELVQWATIIFVMEREHKARLSSRFKPFLAGKRVVCLDIPDRYTFLDPALVKLLRAKVTPLLPGGNEAA